MYGTNARQWTKKFAALLSEVARRGLYKKHGFYSIFEFAAKLAGMGRETVIDILWVARKLEDKPILKTQMEKQGWAKLRVVANIATKENEKILAEKVQEMSKPTLEIFVRELRQQNHKLVQSRPGTAEKPHALAVSQIKLAMPESAFANTAITDATNTDTLAGISKIPTVGTSPPRISVRMPLKPQTELRLRETAGHQSPYAPLCRAHHGLAHHGLIKNEETAPEHWSVKTGPAMAGPKYKIDEKVNGFRRTG